MLRIDFNQVLDRVDIDRVMRRVDINQLVLRSNVPAILAHSTTGIFTEGLDALRKQVILFDLWLMQVAGWMKRFRVDHLLPPGPGARADAERQKPHGRSKTAIAIQGCYTGIVSKGLAILIDILFVTFSFALLLLVVELSWRTLANNDEVQKLDRKNIWAVVAYCGYWFAYFLLTVLLTGRTIGMAIVGIKVVTASSADSLTFTQAFVRTLFLPLSSTVAVFLAVIGFFRRDGRMLHDLIAGTGIIYKWDAGMAHIREAASEPNRSSDSSNDSSSRAALLGEENSGTESFVYSTFEDLSGNEAPVFQGERT